MIVYNKTVIDKDSAYQMLIKATRAGQIKKYILSTIVLICGIFLLFYGYSSNDTNYTGVGYVFLVFSIGYYVVTTIGHFKAPKRVYEKNKDVCENGMVYKYTFKEQSFSVNVESADKVTKLPYKYDAIKKIYEHEDLYEFRLAENQILYIYKNGFENKKMEEFFVKNVSINKKKIISKIKA